MLESPTFAPILHSRPLLQRLSHIIVDESHSVVEAATYRTAYTRLHLLRTTLIKLDMDIPIVQMSATLPPHYLAEILKVLGLRPDTVVINLGNYRPELITVVQELKNGRRQLQDIIFAPPELASAVVGIPQDIVKSIIYIDDVTMLTEFCWWIRREAVQRVFPVGSVDIYHAGLTEEHKDLVSEDFRRSDSAVKVLFASEALGCGSHNRGVQRVVQYQCGGLTLCQLGQRFGRGARDGGYSVGYLLYEKRLGQDGKVSPAQPGTEDPWMLRMIQADECCETIFDKYFANPDRPDESQRTTCCNRCNENLSRQIFTWIEEDPADMIDDESFKISPEMKEGVVKRLQAWRMETWRTDWMQKWARFGPRDVLPDADLIKIVAHAQKAHQIDDLKNVAPNLLWKEISGGLWVALQEAWEAETGESFPTQPLKAVESEAAQSAPPHADHLTSYNRDTAAKALDLARHGGRVKGRQKNPERLLEGEQVFSLFHMD